MLNCLSCCVAFVCCVGRRLQNQHRKTIIIQIHCDLYEFLWVFRVVRFFELTFVLLISHLRSRAPSPPPLLPT